MPRQRVAAYVRHRHAAGLNQVQLRGCQRPNPFRHGLPVCVRQAVVLLPAQRDAGHLGHIAVVQPVNVRLIAVKAHAHRPGHAVRQRQRQRRLACGWIPAQDHHVAAPRPYLLVQPVHPPREIVRRAGVPAEKVRIGVFQTPALDPRPLHQQGVGLVHTGPGLGLVPGLHDAPGNLTQAVQPRLLPQDRRIVLKVRRRGRDVHQLHQHVLLQPRHPRQHRHRVHVPALAENALNRAEDRAVSRRHKVVRRHLLQRRPHRALVDQHRAQQRRLRVQQLVLQQLVLPRHRHSSG